MHVSLYVWMLSALVRIPIPILRLEINLLPQFCFITIFCLALSSSSTSIWFYVVVDSLFTRQHRHNYVFGSILICFHTCAPVPNTVCTVGTKRTQSLEEKNGAGCCCLLMQCTESADHHHLHLFVCVCVCCFVDAARSLSVSVCLLCNVHWRWLPRLAFRCSVFFFIIYFCYFLFGLPCFARLLYTFFFLILCYPSQTLFI